MSWLIRRNGRRAWDRDDPYLRRKDPDPAGGPEGGGQGGGLPSSPATAGPTAPAPRGEEEAVSTETAGIPGFQPTGSAPSWNDRFAGWVQDQINRGFINATTPVPGLGMAMVRGAEGLNSLLGSWGWGAGPGGPHFGQPSPGQVAGGGSGGQGPEQGIPPSATPSTGQRPRPQPAPSLPLTVSLPLTISTVDPALAARSIPQEHREGVLDSMKEFELRMRLFRHALGQSGPRRTAASPRGRG